MRRPLLNAITVAVLVTGSMAACDSVSPQRVARLPDAPVAMEV